MKIGELAKRCGLSAYTLRYYERIGLLPRADRNGSGQRDYDAAILTSIGFLGRLKTTGMPIREMLRYAALREQGPKTAPDCRALLEAHCETARDHVRDLQACLLVLDAKIDGYADEEKRMKDHDDDDFQGRGKPAGARTAGAGGH